jgi:hypothetical protein
MLRWMRFAVFAVFLASALAINARAIKAALGLVISPLVWAPAAPDVAPALICIALATAYAVWLSGATVARWRMPLWTHLVPAGGLVLTLALGPLPLRGEGDEGSPGDRAVEAMRRMVERLETRRAAACAESLREMDELALEGTGYRRFGRALRFHLVVAGEQDEPVRQVRPGDLPGTVYLACARGGRAFWLSAVVTDRLPRGEPAMAVDGVGKTAVLAGEVP